jgi:hypothetical protein
VALELGDDFARRDGVVFDGQDPGHATTLPGSTAEAKRLPHDPSSPCSRLRGLWRADRDECSSVRHCRIEEDVFRAIEQELDLEEVAATRDRPFNLVDA